MITVSSCNLWRINSVINSDWIAVDFAFLSSAQVSNLKVVVDKRDMLMAPTVAKGEKGDKGATGQPGPRGPAGSDVSDIRHFSDA